MMVDCLPPDYITTAIVAGVYFTDKPEFSKHLKKAINSNQSDARALLPYLFIYIGWSKVLLAGAKYFKYRLSLRSKLIVVLF
jgi:hypothetical protein